jgi:2-amino-4-hydroxy-6-hydroxymethyldihydropteridine diphosphokinase
MTRAVVALGANLGDRAATLADAVSELDATVGVSVVAVSPLYDTVAIREDGPDSTHPQYLNGVVLLDTSLDPTSLLVVLHAIEARHGRERHERWGDRTLDLDLIVHGDHVEDGNIVVPHPRAHEREFVLRPWLDVDPDATIPGRGRVADLLDEVDS